MIPNHVAGFTSKPGKYSVAETVDRFGILLQTKGIRLFALIDHSGEAQKIGLEMRPTKLLIFGNPKGGTPLMRAAPTMAIDLPLKVLVWEDGEGKVWIGFNDPTYLSKRHGIPAELTNNISVVEGLVNEVVT